MNWLLKITNRQAATDDGGLSVGGPLFSGQGQVFRGNHGIYKKKPSRNKRYRSKQQFKKM